MDRENNGSRINTDLHGCVAEFGRDGRVVSGQDSDKYAGMDVSDMARVMSYNSDFFRMVSDAYEFVSRNLRKKFDKEVFQVNKYIHSFGEYLICDPNEILRNLESVANNKWRKEDDCK